jgi:uroporphyrinogen III methyltransferase/synthase
MSRPLAHRRFLVTRPENQSEKLAALLREAGAEPLLAPMIAIADTTDLTALDAALARLEDYDLAVFVSPTALDQVTDRLPHWPAEVPAAVVGPSSRDRAEALGIADIICPDTQFDSEGLLMHPALQSLGGKRIVLFRGNGGRELLTETLTARGAQIDVVEAYRRLPPTLEREALANLLAPGCDGVIVTSSEAVQNLFALADGATATQLRTLRFFASHPAIAGTVRGFDVQDVQLTDTGDAGIVESLTRFFAASPDRAADAAAPAAVVAPTTTADVTKPDATKPQARSGPAAPASSLLAPHVRWALGVGVVAVGVTLLLFRSGTQDLHGEMGRRIAGLEKELSEQSARADRHAATLSQLQANLTQSQQAVEELRAQQADLSALYSAVAGDQAEAMLADAELTLSLASQQLQLTANVGAALAALYRLDERLSGHDQARLEPLRRALARDIDALKRVPFVDYVGLSARIDALAGAVDKLPLAIDGKTAEEEKERPDARRDGLLGEFGRALGAIVSIRRIDQPEPALLAPQQALYLREHIKLRLLNARLALLQRDDATFRLDLADADAELRRHFDTRSKPVVTMLTSLHDIALVHPAVALPGLSDSLNAARDARRKVQKEDKR